MAGTGPETVGGRPLESRETTDAPRELTEHDAAECRRVSDPGRPAGLTDPTCVGYGSELDAAAKAGSVFPATTASSGLMSVLPEAAPLR